MKFHASQTHEDRRADIASLKADAATESMTDHRPATAAQRKLNDMAASSTPVQRQMALNAQADNSERVIAQAKLRYTAEGALQRKSEEEEMPAASLMQAKADEELVHQQRASPVQKKEANNTGLPNQLKGGVEALSGMSMDSVKVHYNSDKPAQLNALAYAQGSDIHVGPGQEKHLPHEAWHVVQQAQGRVQPTTQMKDGKTPVNTDAHLEAEADTMGAKAMQMRFGPTPGHAQRK